MMYEVTIRELVKKNILQKIEVEREIGFTFDIATWIMLNNYSQLAIVDWGLMESEPFITKTFYCACRIWHLEKGKKVDFDEDDVKRWVEECMTMKQAKELSDVMFKSQIGGESLEELIPKAIEQNEDLKKKLHGKKLQTTP